jgi:hypothetical protein
MKHLMTALVCLFAMNMSAQTGFVEFPYNPDSDNDDIIGIEDLMGLLSLYGSEFSEEGLYLSTDSTDALYHTGNMYYPQCYKSCNDLPGNWHISTRDEMYKHDLSSLTGPLCYIQADVNGYVDLSPVYHRTMYIGYASDNPLNGRITVDEYQTQRQCYCAAHERPNVEYDACLHLGQSDFYECVDQKLQGGWYPLSSSPSSWSSSQHFTQAFWRWAE